MVFIGGVQLLSLGVIGQYLSKTYLEVKQRPLYFLKETEKDMKKRFYSRGNKWKRLIS